MARTGHTIKLEKETIDEFKGLQENHADAQAFTEELLKVYTEHQENSNEKSPAAKQADRIDELLTQVKRICMAYMEIAADEKQAGIEKAEEMAQAQFSRIRELEATIKQQAEDIQAKKVLLTEATKETTALKQTIESTATLKEAFEKEVTTLKERVVALDAEAKAARNLEKEKVHLQKDLLTKDQAIELHVTKIGTLTAKAKDLETRVTDLRDEVKDLKATIALQKKENLDANADTRQAHGDFRSLTKEHNELKDRLGKTFSDLQDQKLQLAEFYRLNEALKKENEALKKKKPAKKQES